MSDKVLVLGGGLLQIPLIRKAREEGFEVYLSDYYENPPGKKLCHEFRQISTFSIEDNYTYAKEKNIDYIMTIGTDQPVFTAASVSAKLNLLSPITEEQGKLVTNKKYMKARMKAKELPTPAFQVCSKFEELKLSKLNFPLVMKPVDSQGQRGIYVLTGEEENQHLKEWFEVSKKFSLSGSVIFEEFYPGKEITVNTWVKDGQAYNILITDRVHYEECNALGVCKQQRFPSKAAAGYENEIDRVVQKMVDAFEITDGPLYVQMIIGEHGVKLVEFGYRIGGGYESETIPRVSGVDILDLYFNLVTRGINQFQPNMVEQKAKIGSMFWMFAKPGKAEKVHLPHDFEKQFGRLFIQEKQEIGAVEDATSRVGCFGCYFDDFLEYKKFIERYDSELAIYNEKGEDILIHDLWW